MVYDKMDKYIETVFAVFLKVNKNADEKRNEKMKYIAIIMYNYALRLAKKYNVDLANVKKDDEINLIPFFEYISYNNIEFLDFNNIQVEDIDTSKNDDIERYIVSHIYYLTQT